MNSETGAADLCRKAGAGLGSLPDNVAVEIEATFELQ